LLFYSFPILSHVLLLLQYLPFNHIPWYRSLRCLWLFLSMFSIDLLCICSISAAYFFDAIHWQSDNW
jgi:hypothetical protein